MREQDWGLNTGYGEGVLYVGYGLGEGYMGISDETWVISNGFTGG